MNWFKMFAEFATDAKVQSMSEAMQRRLVMFFCLHCQGDLEKLDHDEIAAALRITSEELTGTRELFDKKGFLTSKGAPKNWEKRQKYDPTAAERMKRFREQHRNGAVTEAQPSQNGHRTSYDPPHTPPIDTDTETEVETEKERPPNPHKRGKPSATADDASLPSWLPRQNLDEWLGMRREIKHPVPVSSLPAVIRKLERFKASGMDPLEILESAVVGAYQGLFAADDPRRGKPLSKAKPPEPIITREQQAKADAMIAEGERLIEEARLKRIQQQKANA